MQTIPRPLAMWTQVLASGVVMALLIGVVAGAPGQAWLGFALAAMCAPAWQAPRRSRG